MGTFDCQGDVCAIGGGRRERITRGDATAALDSGNQHKLMGGFVPSLNGWPGNQGTTASCSREKPLEYRENSGRDDKPGKTGTNQRRGGVGIGHAPWTPEHTKHPVKAGRWPQTAQPFGGKSKHQVGVVPGPRHPQAVQA